MTVTREKITRSSRLAGEVSRYHTWPTLRPQSVGEHSWQVLRIYCELFGPPSPEVTVAIVYHDAGELVTGDPPFPVKARNPELKRIYDEMEGRALTEMLPSSLAEIVGRGLPQTQRVQVKICDLLEMWEFGQSEVFVGNRFAEPIVRDTLAVVMDLVHANESAVLTDARRRVMEYVERKGLT